MASSRYSIFKNSSDILTLFSFFRTALKNLVSEQEFFMFAFAIPQGASSVTFHTEAPSPDKIKKKCVLVLRARSKKEVPGGGELNESNMSDEIIFMEINKDVLQNLHGIC
jgi:hypothetical protein